MLFSAHGVPQSYIVAGDPHQRRGGMRQAHRCANFKNTPAQRPANLDEDTAKFLVNGALGRTHLGRIKEQYHLSFQSRVGPVKWLEPYTESKLIELGDSGVKNLVVVPVSFVSEHIETLEEIDMEYRELAEENGISNWRRVSALNTDDGFIKDMAEMVVEALRNPSMTLGEASSQNSEMVTEGSKGGVPSLSLTAERINGRFAMLGIAFTTLAEVINGHPIIHGLIK